MENGAKAFKAGIWYTISNFFIRGLSILSTPIFTRLMSLEEYGNYSNFTSWMNILMILTTMDLHATINRARFDFKDDYDSYLSSITITGIAIPSLFYLSAVIFPGKAMGILQMDMTCIHFMFLNIVFSGAINVYQVSQRVAYKYKKSVLITLSSTCASVALSLLLVFWMDNTLYGRIIGQTLPAILVNCTLALGIIKKAPQKLSMEYVKYAVKICLPYIPHLLAMNILSQYDRIQIKSICGADAAALYSVAYSCALIINILINSMNTAWSPWLGEMIHKGEYKKIQKTAKVYVMGFELLAVMFFLVSPELLLIFGGEKYRDALWVMPPVIAGAMLQFIYTLYVNIEMYEKKVWGVAGATGIAAVLNILLNALLIPRYGYIAAAYTTLFCYGVLCVLHYSLAKKIKMNMVYDNRFILAGAVVVLPLMRVSQKIYLHPKIRWSIVGIYVLAGILVVAFNWRRIKEFMWQRNKK